MDYTQDYNTFRKSDTEKKNLEKVFQKHYSDARKGAEVHRQVRHYIQNWFEKNIIFLILSPQGSTRNVDD
jgi:hypothetical protein